MRVTNAVDRETLTVKEACRSAFHQSQKMSATETAFSSLSCHTLLSRQPVNALPDDNAIKQGYCVLLRVQDAATLLKAVSDTKGRHGLLFRAFSRCRYRPWLHLTRSRSRLIGGKHTSVQPTRLPSRFLQGFGHGKRTTAAHNCTATNGKLTGFRPGQEKM